MTPERFAEAAAGWVQRGAQIVGGCCGTGPDHTRALRDALPPVLME
jgi:methionine synthase I (cobalamin-dependent)